MNRTPFLLHMHFKENSKWHTNISHSTGSSVSGEGHSDPSRVAAEAGAIQIAVKLHENG